MSSCVKTGINIWLRTHSCMVHTDAHYHPGVLIFTSCDEAHRRYDLSEKDADLIVEDQKFYLGRDHTIVASAFQCVLISRELFNQWARFNPTVLNMVVVRLPELPHETHSF